MPIYLTPRHWEVQTKSHKSKYILDIYPGSWNLAQYDLTKAPKWLGKRVNVFVNPGTKRYMFPEFLSRNANIAILVILLLYPRLLLPIEVFQMVKMCLF